VKKSNGKVTIAIDLEPAGSAMFTISGSKADEPEYKPVAGTETLVESTGPVTVNRESDNIMMVNYLDLKTAKSENKGVYFMNALIGLFEENGIEMGNPWQHKIQYKKTYLEMDTLFKTNSWFEATYHFNINPNFGDIPMKNIRAVVERPELWKVFINGNEVSRMENTFWIDRSFPQFSVGEYLKTGHNTLTLKAPRMHILAEVAPIYLLGDFAVKPGTSGFEIAAGKIDSLGSWSRQGMPFYSQKVGYTQKFSVTKIDGAAYLVKLNQWNGTVAEVVVNGNQAGLIAWKPYELNVTSLLTNGENNITVNVTGSLKNTFGFFFEPANNWIYGPHTWNNAPQKAPGAEGYFLPGYGLMEPFKLVEVK
jgi:hypothetical protein